MSEEAKGGGVRRAAPRRARRLVDRLYLAAVSVAIENGGDDPAVAIRRVAEAGAVGGSIEDWDLDVVHRCSTRRCRNARGAASPHTSRMRAPESCPVAQDRYNRFLGSGIRARPRVAA